MTETLIKKKKKLNENILNNFRIILSEKNIYNFDLNYICLNFTIMLF